LTQQVTDFVEAAESMTDLGLLAPARCTGWSRLDVVVHVRMGLQEMVTGVEEDVDGCPDHDAASYWRSHPDDRDDDPAPHILWLRRTAVAYSRPSAAVRHLRAVAQAVPAGLGRISTRTVAFQGKTMTTGDFVATWVAELAVHELDLDLGPRRNCGLPWARRTLEALAEADLPADLDDATAVLVGLGRVPAPDGTSLDHRFPVSL
jgi:hypothetical protein